MDQPSDQPSTVAQQLLEAHVAYEVAALRADAAGVAMAGVDRLLAVAGDMPLETVVRRDLVKAVATKYVARHQLPGAIP